MEELSVTNKFSAVPDLDPAAISDMPDDIIAPHLYAVHYPHEVIVSPLDDAYNAFLKRSLDIIISSIMIIGLLSWLIPILGIIIKLDSRGPVFFMQRRNRNGGRFFNCFKFRSMIVNSDSDTKPSGEHDPRITRVGKILRRYHLDELPQLFNVFIGQMSLVGPRPLMVRENMRFSSLWPEYGSRHSVKPGITGLAQSLGHFGATVNANEMRSRLDLDLHYISNWSMLMDIRILWRTLIRSF